MNKLFIWIIGLVLLSSFSFGLNFTNPVQSQNSSRYLNVSWSDPISASSISYNLSLYNGSTFLYNVVPSFISSSIDSSTIVSTFGGSVSKSQAFVSRRVFNVSVTGGTSDTNYDATITATFFYDDGTSQSAGSAFNAGSLNCGSALTLSNPDSSKGVVNITVTSQQSDSGRQAYLCAVNFNAFYVLKYFNLFMYDLNLSLSNYSFNVSSLNNSVFFQSNVSGAFNVVNNSLLNISAYSGASLINSFNVRLTDNVTGVNYNASTSNGYVLFDGVRNRVYSIFINASNYSYYFVNSTLSSPSNLLLASLVATNSVNISVFNEFTGNLINQSIIMFIYPSVGFSNYTLSNGNGLIANLPVGNYSMTFSANGYSDRSYILSLVQGSTQSFSAYLINVSSAQNLSMCVVDGNGVAISALRVDEEVLSSSSYVLSQSVMTDVNGRLSFVYNPSSYYRYTISTPAYVTRQFLLSPPSNAVVLDCGCNYCVTLSAVASTVSYPSFNVSGSSSFNNVTKFLTFTYSSSSSYSNYSYSVSKWSGSSYVVLCSGTSTLSANSFSCNLFGYTGTVYVQGVVNGNQVFYGQWVSLGGRPGLFDSRSPLDANYIAGFIFLVVVCAGLAFGIYGALIFSVAGVLTIFVLGIVSPLTLSLCAVALIVAIVIAIGIKRY